MWHCCKGARGADGPPTSLVDHPNVISLVGYSVAPYAIVMEYLPNGVFLTPRLR